MRGLLHSDDTQVMMAALQKLGLEPFDWLDNGATVVVHGADGKLCAPPPGQEVCNTSHEFRVGAPTHAHHTFT